MQFSTIFTSLMAAAVAVATPMPKEAPSVESQTAEANQQISALKAKGCSVGKCIAALAPQSAVCMAALVEPTPFGEVICIATLANSNINTPEPCKGC